MIDQAVLDRLDPLVADIAARGAEIEALGQLPDDLACAMSEADLLRLLVPSRYGGAEVHPSTFVEKIFTTSRADGAVGWFSMIANTTGSLAATLAPEWADKLYQNQTDAITVGVAAPIGKATRDGDGLRVTGRWPFGSGAHNARWISGGAMLPGEGDDPPQPIMAFFPRKDVLIHSNWQVSGLCGTGSNDIEVEDAYVPPGRWVNIGGRTKVDRPLYRFPTMGLLALGVSAVSLGIAQRAVDEFLDLATVKVPRGSVRTLANRAGAQKDLAIAQARVSSARAFVHSAIDEAWSAACSADRLDKPIKAKLRLAATNATWSAIDAVDRLYHAAGGSAIYQSSVLQKCFRDVHVTTQHAMVAQPTLEVVGKVMLGIDPKTFL